jgi:hypothetical protein
MLNETAKRLARQAKAKERAATLPRGDYYAYDNWLYERQAGPVLECESHWDACLVMMEVSRSGTDE